MTDAKVKNVTLELTESQFNLLGSVFANCYEEFTPGVPEVNDSREVFQKKFKRWRAFNHVVLDILGVFAEAQKKLEEE